MKKAKIKPFVSAGEVFLNNDGVTFQIVPLSLFVGRNGGPTLRIGRNIYCFNRDGSYDGPECKCEVGVNAEAIAEALSFCAETRNVSPEEAYFDPGSRGHTDETAIWPTPDQHPRMEGPDPKVYVIKDKDEGEPS